jgi:hypothetical protein
MVTITDMAVEKVKEILKAEGKEDWGLRIFLSGGGCCGPAYGMDLDEQPKENDEILEKDGLNLKTKRPPAAVAPAPANRLKRSRGAFPEAGVNCRRGSVPPRRFPCFPFKGRGDSAQATFSDGWSGRPPSPRMILFIRSL